MERKTNQTLREVAEQRLRDQPKGGKGLSPQEFVEIADVLHELQVHQIELEMQNVELRRIQEELETTRDRYIDLYDFAPIGYLTLDMDGAILEANLVFAAMLGVERGKLLGTFLSRFVISDDQDVFFLHRSRLFESQEAQTAEVHLVKRNGSTFQARLYSVLEKDQGPGLCRMTISDISEQTRAEKELRLAARVLESTVEGVMITDADANIITVNRAFTTITGYFLEDVAGKNPRFLKSGYQNDEFYRNMWKSLLDSGQWVGEIWNRGKDGQVFPQWMNISAVKNPQGKTTHYVSVFNDISKMKRAEERIQYQATHDVLTDLPNRVLFMDRFEHALTRAHRNKEQVAVIFLDLDRFKVINDTLGHLVGDQVLQVVAKRLANSLRESDTIARMGGDEFTFLLENVVQQQNVIPIVLKFLNAVSQPFTLDGQEFNLGASIGISLYPSDGLDTDTLLKNADRAMYHAKEDGAKKYIFFAPEMNAELQKRRILENSLFHAIQRRELDIVYQPQVDPRSGEILGVEALLLWNHATLGEVSPKTIISLAEETGQIESICDWMLGTVCRQNMAWGSERAASLRISLAMNLSAYQYQRHDLVSIIARTMGETGMPPELLELELTQGILIKNPETAATTLHQLKALGVSLSIDDFGTGYSSLSYLYRFPINTIKIDSSFVGNITQDDDSAAIVSAIINLAHVLGLKVVAGGVETAEQLDFLRAKGCDQVQGSFFSPSLAADGVTRLLQEDRRLGI